jgi:hypothetical protein
LFSSVPAVGIEPTTNGLQNAFVLTWSFVNQTLAALANLETGVIKAQLRHSQSGKGTIDCRRSFSPEVESQDASIWTVGRVCSSVPFDQRYRAGTRLRQYPGRRE